MHRIIFLATLITLIGCKNPKKNLEQLPTPETFNDSKSSLNITSRYSEYSDLIQELYAELVSNDEEIGAFDEQRLDYNAKLLKAEESFENYHAHSVEYYITAKQYALSIKDSTYSKRLLSRIEASENKYEKSLSSLENTIQLLINEDSLFDDRFSGLQVELTLKMMEVFQENEMPNSKKFESLIETQKALNQQIESLAKNEN